MDELLFYYKKCLTKDYANFKGRASREEYWMFVLVNALIMLPLAIVIAIEGEKNIYEFIFNQLINSEKGKLFFITFIYVLYSIIITLPALAVKTRRLHDRGRTGKLILLEYIPFLGFIATIILFVMCVLPGKAGENRYGHNPKE